MTDWQDEYEKLIAESEELLGDWEPKSERVIEVTCECGNVFVTREGSGRKICPQEISKWREQYVNRKFGNDPRSGGMTGGYGPY